MGNTNNVTLTSRFSNARNIKFTNFSTIFNLYLENSITVNITIIPKIGFCDNTRSLYGTFFKLSDTKY